MVTKGYGFSVNDIDWSSPADLEPYSKTYKLQMQQTDMLMHVWFGSYALSAVSVAVEHCLAGTKAKSKYIKENVLKDEFAKENLTEEEIANKEIEKAIILDDLWIKELKKKGLPETVI